MKKIKIDFDLDIEEDKVSKALYESFIRNLKKRDVKVTHHVLEIMTLSGDPPNPGANTWVGTGTYDNFYTNEQPPQHNINIISEESLPEDSSEDG